MKQKTGGAIVSCSKNRRSTDNKRTFRLRGWSSFCDGDWAHPLHMTEYKANPTGQAMENVCPKGGIRDVDVYKTSCAGCIFADRLGVMYGWLWNVPEGANS